MLKLASSNLAFPYFILPPWATEKGAKGPFCPKSWSHFFGLILVTCRMCGHSGMGRHWPVLVVLLLGTGREGLRSRLQVAELPPSQAQPYKFCAVIWGYLKFERIIWLFQHFSEQNNFKVKSQSVDVFSEISLQPSMPPMCPKIKSSAGLSRSTPSTSTCLALSLL